MKRKGLVILVVLLIAAGASAMVYAGRWSAGGIRTDRQLVGISHGEARERGSVRKELHTSVAAPVVSSSAAHGDSRLPAVAAIVIRPTGFRPATIIRPAGRILFKVDNRSGFKEVALRLDKVGGERLIDVRVPRARLDWHAVLELTPGSYVLSEANNPRWTCNITITPAP